MVGVPEVICMFTYCSQLFLGNTKLKKKISSDGGSAMTHLAKKKPQYCEDYP